tara:strand:- start:307 stop:465 length:159 start_codon:yes stop_codon:yes gene_type:complete
MVYLIKATDSRENTSILHEVQCCDEAKELQEWERMKNPEHYVFTDIIEEKEQ